MSTTEPTEQTRSDRNRIGSESIRDSQDVAWYARGDGELSYPLDTPVSIGEVYELVSVMLKAAPFDHLRPTAECATEVMNQRAWAGFVELVYRIFVHSLLYDLPNDDRSRG